MASDNQSESLLKIQEKTDRPSEISVSQLPEEIELEIIGGYVFGYLASLLVVGAQGGMTLSNVNTVTDTLKWQMKWGDDAYVYETILQSMTNAGVAIGSLGAGAVVARGRRRTILWSSILNFFILIPTLVEIYWLMVVCKFIWGVSNGITGIAVARLIEEVLPPKMMRKYGALFNLSLAFGAMLSILLGLILPKHNEYKKLETTQLWRVVFGFPIFLSFI